MAKLEPFLLRDFRQGRYTLTQVTNFLVPLNSASHSVNVNFDTVVGQGVVRPGTTKLGATVSAGNSPLGLAEFVGKGGTPNLLLAVFNGDPNVAGSGTISAFADPNPGTGTITDDGAGNITGVGTLFSTQLIAGDLITVPGQGTYAIVVTITNNTSMVVDRNTAASAETFNFSLLGGNNIYGIAGTAFNTQLTVGMQIQVPAQGTTAVITTINNANNMVVDSNTLAHNNSFTFNSDASIYYYNTAWHTSTKTNLAAGVRDRFATLGGSSFITNSFNGMFDSTDGNTWGTTNSITGVLPSVVYRYTARLVAAGDPIFPDRVYFSSIVNSNASPFITWNTDPDTGDWIDVNPDDGGSITGFSETSTFLLVFKNTGMYRMDTLSKSTDPNNIYNVGAVSQEAITLCQGITYYYSGIDIRRTNGGFPDQISRAGVQDIIDAIPQANKINVYAWNDDLNVYFRVGTVTLYEDTDRQVIVPNCVLKFSPRDQNWSVHSYADDFRNGVSFTTPGGRYVRVADIDGDVQTLNLGTTDNGVDINFYFESQDLEFGSRAMLKQISDKLIVFMNNGIDSNIQFRTDGADVKDVKMNTNRRVNIGKDINMQANFFNFIWFGSSKGTAPALEGFYIEDISGMGTTTKHG